MHRVTCGRRQENRASVPEVGVHQALPPQDREGPSGVLGATGRAMAESPKQLRDEHALAVHQRHHGHADVKHHARQLQDGLCAHAAPLMPISL